MPFQQLRANRINYTYPAVALGGDVNNVNVIHFNTTTDLDSYHLNLFSAQTRNEKILGYLSVLFWGFYSGQDGVARENRALGKVNLAFNGSDRIVRGRIQRMRGVTDYGFEVVAEYLDSAINMIFQDRYGEALENLMNLPQLQIAFASKLCAFIDSRKCGVIDSVIARNHPEFGFSVSDRGIVKNTVANRNRYNDYCQYLQVTAQQINQHSADLRWSDRDNSLHNWRALDVERSMY